ncbi:MAG: hypothetical protein CFE29_15950 [Bradyrhizobiaceae bacterium PARB1]|nr:MAG: hypothetical protein CFE29_15950 [Bradyrhizobiaceae bacterium PARB1]
MTVYMHKNSPYWQICFQLSKRKFSYSSETTCHATAVELEDEYRAQAKRDLALEMAAGPRVTFNQAMHKYWKLKVFDPRPKELKTDEKINREIAKFDALTSAGKQVGLDTLCADVDTTRMLEIREELKSATANTATGRLKPSAINRQLELIFCVLNFARDHMSTPLPKRPRMKEIKLVEDDRDRIIDYDDETAICEHLDEDFQAAFVLELETAIRSGDVIGLQWSQVRLKQRHILAHRKSKGRKIYKVWLNDRAVAILEQMKGLHPTHVFTRVVETTAIVDGEPVKVATRIPYKKSHFGTRMKKAFEAAKVDDLTFHDLRRTAGTRYYLATKDYEATRQFLGHSSVEVTKRYIKIALENVIEGVFNMERDRAGRGWRLKPSRKAATSATVEKIVALAQSGRTRKAVGA